MLNIRFVCPDTCKINPRLSELVGQGGIPSETFSFKGISDPLISGIDPMKFPRFRVLHRNESHIRKLIFMPVVKPEGNNVVFFIGDLQRLFEGRADEIGDDKRCASFSDDAGKVP